MSENEQYIIIRNESVTIPGDERSRTNPGHGYPEHTDTYQKVEYFTDRAKWEAEVARLQSQRWGSFKAGKFIPAKITTTTEVITP